MKVSLDTRVSVKEDVLIRQIGAESVLLDLNGGHYVGLDDVGTRFWEALTEFRSLRAAFESLQSEFEVEDRRLQEDLIALVQRLVENGLLEVSPD